MSRFLAILLFSAVLELSAQTTTFPVHIRGMVLDDSTGQPLLRANLTIPTVYAAPLANSPGLPPVIRPSITATTDAGGKFTLDVPEAGPHTIYVRNNNYEPRQITLSAEEERKGVELVLRLHPLPAKGVVSGRAIDVMGRPIVGAKVELLGYRRMSQISLGAYSDHPEFTVIATRETDDRGEYRLFDVAPDRYFLRIPPPGKPGDTMSPLSAVFYPGLPGLTNAKSFVIRAGDDVQLGDLVLMPSILQPIRVLTTDLTGGRVLSSAPTLTLFGGPAADNPPATRGFLDGAPAIRPDEPGNYTICSSLDFLVETPTRFAYTQNACADVVYTGGPQEITLTIRKQAAHLTGRVLLRRPDGAPAIPLANVRIGGVGIGPGSNYGGLSDKDGFFKSLTTVPDGPIAMRFLNAPDGYYIESIHQGTRDAMIDGVLVAGDDTNLDVRASQGVGKLNGTIVGGDGKPVDYAIVVLLPEGQLAVRPDKDNTHRTSTTNLNGSFEIRNIIPGKYRVYAFTKIEDGAYLDAKFFQPYEEQSTLVEIGRDATVSTQLRQIQ